MVSTLKAHFYLNEGDGWMRSTDKHFWCSLHQTQQG